MPCVQLVQFKFNKFVGESLFPVGITEKVFRPFSKFSVVNRIQFCIFREIYMLTSALRKLEYFLP